MRVGLLVCGGLCLRLAACTGVISDPGAPFAEQPAADGGTVVVWQPRDAGSAPRPASVSRRLSRAELDHTLRDLLGDDSAPATRLLPEDLYSPYDNDVSGQLASSAFIDSLSALASDVATRAVANQQVVPCTPSEACFRQVAAELLPRALRRPVTDSELQPYLQLFALANEQQDEAVSLLIQALVLDPEFLYRVEARGTLTEHEIATRLSYLLWGTTPDEALLQDARAGRLTPVVERKRVFERMWNDARTRQRVARFHALWLGYRALPHEPQLSAAFARETDALIERVIFDEPQSYLQLFASSETYLDNSLAAHYGLPAPDADGAWVRYPDDSGRAGILSHGSVLSAFGKFSDTSPTQRGIFVRTRLMCQPIPPPPPSVAADKPPAGTSDATCKVDRYAQHRSDSACAGCHALTDAISFGLERFDNAGRYRTHDEGLDACAISGEGELSGVGQFQGPKELARLLLDEGAIAPCLVEQFVQFALGRAPVASELTGLQAQFRAQNYSFAGLVEAFVMSPDFTEAP